MTKKTIIVDEYHQGASAQAYREHVQQMRDAVSETHTKNDHIESQQPQFQRLSTVMFCRAQSISVQIEVETDGQQIRNATCGVQKGCHRYMKLADMTAGVCILVE